jgi:hypothetical protein
LKEREFIFFEPDEKVQEVVAQIMNQHPNFPSPSYSPDGIWADPYVIALAKVKKAVVITGEIPADPKAKKIKMPDVCMKMGVDWANFCNLSEERVGDSEYIHMCD